MNNFHSHTRFCDGSDHPEAYIVEAIKQGFQRYGFSSHAPIPLPNNFALTTESFPEYQKEILRLRMLYKDKIEIFLGIEADFISGITNNFDDFRKTFKLDYIIGSVHVVINNEGKTWFIDGSKQSIYDEGLMHCFDNDIRRAIAGFYHQTNTMIESEHFEILGHLDKITMHNQNRFFTTDQKWYQNLVFETIDLIKEKNVVVEVNTRGLYKKRSNDFFPETFILKHLFAKNIPVMISSDAHKPDEISLLHQEAKSLLKKIGYKEQAIIDKNGLNMIAL
jgi:histidinol-phosphatase (PHP family)